MPSGRFSAMVFPGTGFWKTPVMAILFVFLHLMTASASPSGSSQHQNPVENLEKIRLQLKWRHNFQFAGYYAAIEKGYFRDEGLDVELIEGMPGVNPAETLLTGDADFAIESPAVLIKRQQNPSLVVLAAIFQHSPACVVTLKSSGLTTPQSLSGKRIMLTSHWDFETLAMLEEEGISLDSVNIVLNNWDISDLISGKVDAEAAYMTNEPYLFDKQGIAVTTIRPSNYGIDFYGDCIVSTEDEIRNHEKRVEGFLRAVRLGWIYAMKHPQEIAELIKSRYAKDTDLDHLLFEAETMKGLIQPDLVEIGHMSPARWKYIADTLVRLKMLPANYTLQGFLYSDLRDSIALQKQRKVNLLLSTLAATILLFLGTGLMLFVFNRKLADQVEKRTASLTESEQHFRTLFEMAAVGVAKANIHDGQYERINKKYCDITGYAEEELHRLTFLDITHPEDLHDQKAQIKDLLDGKANEVCMEKRYITKGGQIIWVHLTASPLWKEGQKPEFIMAIIRDISLHKLADEKLVFAHTAFENAIEGISITNADGILMHVNPAFSSITGYSPEEAIGKTPRLLKSERYTAAFYDTMWKDLREKGQWAGEIWNRRKNGEIYPEWLTISAVRDQHGKITNYVSIFHDVTDLKRQQDALRHQAQHDALTGLPNRLLINDRLEMALTRIKRNPAKLALLYLDLDNFKYINGAFGHTAGDSLLIKASGRFAALLRAGDTMARLGEDEFLVLLPEVKSIAEVSLIALSLINCLKNPFYHGDAEYFITVSIGVTIAPEDGLEAVSLIKYANNAMYRAKTLGRNNYQFYTPELDVKAHRRISMETKMRRGLDRGDFEVFYQPLVHMDSGEIIGAEALVRWRDEGKLISPAEFIPLAEDSGLILPLGAQVLQTAAHQAKLWQDAGYHLGISVNISSHQFAGQDLLGLLRETLKCEGLAPGRLYFEITESIIMGDIDHARRVMGDLRQLGMKFYLDDFGTGYSSLSYLKRLPIDGLKIDYSFIRDIVEDDETYAIVSVIVSLAKILDLTIVAEGVETDAQWQVLNGMGNILIQGFLASPPLPAGEFQQLLKKGRIEWRGPPV